MSHDDLVVSVSDQSALPDDIVDDAHADWLESIGYEGLAHIRRFVRAHATGKDVPHESLVHVVKALKLTLDGIVDLQKRGSDDSKTRGALLVDVLGLKQPRGRRKREHQNIGDVRASQSYKLARAVVELQALGKTKAAAVSHVVNDQQLNGLETTRQTINTAYRDYRPTVVLDMEAELYQKKGEPLQVQNRKFIEQAVEEQFRQYYVAEGKVKLKLLERLSMRASIRSKIVFDVEIDEEIFSLSIVPSQCKLSINKWLEQPILPVLESMVVPVGWPTDSSINFQDLIEKFPMKVTHAAIIALEKFK